MLELAFALFIIANPIGNIPGFVALLKDFPLQRQRWILLRETIFALLLCLFFEFFGDFFLDLLLVRNYTITISGGIVLFLTSLSMIFSKESNGSSGSSKQEPFIVPIATPLLAGGGLLTTVMLFSHQVSKLTVTLALLLAWVPVIICTTCSPYLLKICGKRGLGALEQLFGMLLLMLSCNLIVNGLGAFIKSL